MDLSIQDDEYVDLPSLLRCYTFSDNEDILKTNVDPRLFVKPSIGIRNPDGYRFTTLQTRLKLEYPQVHVLTKLPKISSGSEQCIQIGIGGDYEGKIPHPKGGSIFKAYL